MYDIIVPLYGKYFILKWGNTAEIIDSNTFKTVEVIDSNTFKLIGQLSPPNIIDIWGDRLLSGSFSKNHFRYFFEKKIGASQWNDLVSAQGNSANARFIYNGAITVTDSIGQAPNQKGLWFMIENGRKSDPVSTHLGGSPSLNALSRRFSVYHVDT